MLLRFSVANHRSLRDEQELTMVALDDHPDLAIRPAPGPGKESVLPVAGIFGSNASGKSNVVSALSFMRRAVVDSHQRWSPENGIPRAPFSLDAQRRGDASEFEVDIVVSDVRYNYGFACTDLEVTKEWLYSYPQNRRRLLYERQAGRAVNFGSTLTGPKALVTQVMRPNSLYLSAAAANNHEELLPVYRWFSRSVKIATDLNEQKRLHDSITMLEEEDREGVLSLMRFADLGVVGMKVTRPMAPPHAVSIMEETVRRLGVALPDETQVKDFFPPRVQVRHLSKSGDATTLDFQEESSGTRTWLTMIGPVLRALKSGDLLVVDEMDARLHSTLASRLVELFQDPEANRHGAQLLFNAHDTTLLGRYVRCRLRRDQVWFTEKDPHGATRLFPLTEYRVREGLDNVEKSYLAGRYGAVPFLDDRELEGLLTSDAP
jgi:hypothetical protein